VAEPVVADVLRPLARSAGMPHEAVDVTAVVLALVLATLAQMLFGELVPQNLAISRPLAVARAVIPLQRAWARAGRPVVSLFDGAANAIVRALGVTPRQELRAARTPAELRSVITSSAEEGTLDVETAQLLRRALAFGEKTAGDVMTSRVRIVALQVTDTAADLIDSARSSGRSRFPVAGEDLDDVLGVVHVKHAFGIAREQRGDVTVRTLMDRPLRVPESLDCDALLKRLSIVRAQLAVVVDEYGGTAGVVTLEDVVEELVGEVSDEHDRTRSGVVRLRDGSYVVPGLLRPDEVRARADLAVPDGTAFETVGGYVMARLGRVPRVGDEVDIPGAVLRVDRMEGRRVDRLRALPRPEEEP